MKTAEKYVVVAPNNEQVSNVAPNWETALKFKSDLKQYFDNLTIISFDEYLSKKNQEEYESMMNPKPSILGNEIPRY